MIDLPPERVLPSLAATTKKEVLRELATAIVESGLARSVDELCRILQERENLGSTGIGEGIALPHGKVSGIEEVLICFGRSEKGVPYESLDGRPAHLFFVMLAPEGAAGAYLSTLARLSRILKNPVVRTKLMQARDPEEIRSILKASE